MATHFRYPSQSDLTQSRRVSPIPPARPPPPQLSPVVIPSYLTEHGNGIDLQMRMFMAEKARANSVKPLKKGHKSKSSSTSISKLSIGPPGPPMLTTNTAYFGNCGSAASAEVSQKRSGFHRHIRQKSQPQRRLPVDHRPPKIPMGTSLEEGLILRDLHHSRSGAREKSTNKLEYRSHVRSISCSPPPPPPEKDVYWKDMIIRPATAGASTNFPTSKSPNQVRDNRRDSVILPPPPTATREYRQRPNGPNLQIAVSEPTEHEKIVLPKEHKLSHGAKKRKDSVFDQVLGMWPASENKMPVGRSITDDFVSNLARKFTRKGAQPPEEPISSKSMPDSCKEANSLKAISSPDQPWTADPTLGFVAELPGDIPEFFRDEILIMHESKNHPSTQPPAPAEPSTDTRSRPKTSAQSQSRSRSKSRTRAKKGGNDNDVKILADKDSPEIVSNEGAYAKMPLPAVPPLETSSSSSHSLKPVETTTTAKQIKAINTTAATTATTKKDNNSPPPCTPLFVKISKKRTSIDGDSKGDASSPEYGQGITDWATEFFQSPPTTPTICVSSPPLIDTAARFSIIHPEGAVRGLAYPSIPKARVLSYHIPRRNSSSRTALLVPTDWTARASYASSAGDAFQYDGFDKDLGTIGEDELEPSSRTSLYGELDIHFDISTDDVVPPSHGTITKFMDFIRAETASVGSDDDDKGRYEFYNDYYDFTCHRNSIAGLAGSAIEPKINATKTPRNSPAHSIRSSVFGSGSGSDYTYSETSPSTPGFLESEVDELLAEENYSSPLLMGTGIDIGITQNEKQRSADGRRTQYLAGRSSSIDGEIIFCIKSSEFGPPVLPSLEFEGGM
jgi:hypothetical protein